MCARPWARHLAAVWKPRSTPSAPPTSASAGTRTSSRYTSAVQAPNWPILWSLGPIESPFVPEGTRNVEMPRLPTASGLVRANTMITSATGALVM
jgi:hypothetical protein